MINFARNDAVRFQLAQLLRQHFLGGIGQESAQLAEALGAVMNEVMNDDGFPFASQDIDGGTDGAKFESHSFRFVTMTQNSA
jgi:hypothetical protein